MLEEATPRAQLHVQRILGSIHTDGDVTVRSVTQVRVSPPRPPPATLGLKSRGVFDAHRQTSHHRQRSGKTRHPISPRPKSAPHTISVPHSTRHEAAGAAVLALATSALLEGSEEPHAAPTRSSPSRERSPAANAHLCAGGLSPLSSATRRERVSGVPTGRSAETDPAPPAVAARQVGNGVHHVRPDRSAAERLAADETHARQCVEASAFGYAEGAYAAWRQSAGLARVVNDASRCLAQVIRFVRTPPEEVLRDPVQHLAATRDAALEPVRAEEMVFYLQRIPAALAASYEQLLAPDPTPHEGEEPMPAIAIPQPHPHQQLQLQLQPLQPSSPQLLHSGLSGMGSQQDMGLYVRRPSSVCSRVGSVQLGQRMQARSGHMSPHVVIANDSLGSIDDIPSCSTFIANTVMRQMGRDDTVALDNLREENAYWQEETLRAMAEAERYHQLTHLLLGGPAGYQNNNNNTSTNNNNNNINDHHFNSNNSMNNNVTTNSTHSVNCQANHFMQSPTSSSLPGASASYANTAGSFSGGDGAPRRPSSTGLSAPRGAAQRAFLQLLLEKEEGNRGTLAACESQCRWDLWAQYRNVIRGKPRADRLPKPNPPNTASVPASASSAINVMSVLAREDCTARDGESAGAEEAAIVKQRRHSAAEPIHRNGREEAEERLRLAQRRIEELERSNAALYAILQNNGDE